MSQLPSQEEYERVKNEYKSMAKEKEKLLSSDLVAVRNDFLPKYLKGKLLMGCAVFAATYMLQELVFRKKVPGLVKFAGALSATVAAPRIYQTVYENYFEVRTDHPLNTPVPPEEEFPLPPEAVEDQ